LARRLSIGARWTLRYAAAMAVTLAVFALFVQAEVERRINREAPLVTEIQARGLVDSLRTQTEEHGPERARDWLEARMAREVAESPPDLGIEYLDAEGRSRIAVGSLAGEALPVPRDLVRGERDRATRAANLGGEHAHIVTVLPAPGGFLQVAIDTRRYAENVEHFRDVWMVAFPVVLGLTAVLGWALARGSLSPISEMTRAARRISGANLRETIPTGGSEDELDQLAQTLNGMMARIRTSVERMQRFNANAAHELSTPLNALRNEIDVTLARARDPEEYRRVLADVLDKVGQLARAVDAMLRLARSEAGLDPARVEQLALAPLLEAVAEFFAPVAGDRGIALELRSVPDVALHGDPAWLQQVFSNLIDNAIKYGESGGHITVEAELEGGGVAVRVADDGPGIAPGDLDGIFDRFQRGDRHRQRPGFGLGLPLAREITHAHGGRLGVGSQPGKGSTFTVWLPVY